MKNVIVIVIALVLVGYVAVQASTAYRSHTELANRVEYHLDFVSAPGDTNVTQDIVHDARKFGIDVRPSDIRIIYDDTQQRSVAQQIVGNRLGTQFTNKRIAINVHYTARILGIPIGQDITRSKIKQVAAPRQEPSSEMKSLLDAVPQ